MKVNAIATVILLMATLPAAAATEEERAAIERGAVLVESRCVFCHNQEALPDLVKRCASREGRVYLDTFLTRHYAPDEAARADIIAFLTCDPADLQDN